MGAELETAIERLTDKQLLAYGYRRKGQAWDWIATRMGMSRTAVIHHAAKAEKRLGYEPTVTAKQRSPYKPVAQRRADAVSAEVVHISRLLTEMEPGRRRHIMRIVETSTCEGEANCRVRKRLELWAVEARRERERESLAQFEEVRREMDGLTGRYLDIGEDVHAADVRGRRLSDEAHGAFSLDPSEDLLRD
jgi:hypothetical protein